MRSNHGCTGRAYGLGPAAESSVRGTSLFIDQWRHHHNVVKATFASTAGMSVNDSGGDQRLTVAALTYFRASAVEADLRERALVVLGMYRWGWISKRDASMPASAVSSARDQFQPR